MEFGFIFGVVGGLAEDGLAEDGLGVDDLPAP